MMAGTPGRWGPRLGGVTNLSIQSLHTISLFFLDCFHMRGGVPRLGGGLPGQSCQVTRLGGVSFLHANAKGGVG